MEKKGRIGIPRALMFYRYVPFWQGFFEALGWEVVVSENVGRQGKIIYFEDSCLPMKLMITHASQLSNDVDHLFIPRLVSLHPKHILCPKFRGAPDIVRLAIERKISILDETIDLRTPEQSLKRAFLRIGEKLGASPRESQNAFSKAGQFFSACQKGWIDRINRLPTKDLFRLEIPTPIHEKTCYLPRPCRGEVTSPLPSTEGESGSTGFRENKGVPLQVAFIGHPYNLFDTDINKDILGLAKQLGMEILTSDLLSERVMEKEISNLSKEIYWSSGREIIGSLFHFLSGGVDGVVFITSFKCGIDALLQEFVKRMLRIRGGSMVPFLTLSFDEHTGREGLTTRLEAFKDVMTTQERQQAAASKQ
jgi:predicted nucleotide-binding protein (sugar kinase/HSP70/actin superfamily)